MSQHTITRIANVLEGQFGGRIDMSDWDGKPEAIGRKHFCHERSLPFVYGELPDVEIDVASKAVTDGFGDNGLDAIFFDQNNDTLIVVQSKWSVDGTKPIDADGAGAMAAGLRDLLAGHLDRFNEKIKAKKPEVTAALYSERPIKLSFITAHTATQPTALFVKRKIDDLVAELNDPVSLAESTHYDQAGIYNLITSEFAPPKIRLQIGLKDWGVIEKPFLAYYGRVHVDEILQWWSLHNNALFTKNLRLFRFNSDVNDARNGLSQSLNPAAAALRPWD